jgi:hypothetical protein
MRLTAAEGLGLDRIARKWPGAVIELDREGEDRDVVKTGRLIARLHHERDTYYYRVDADGTVLNPKGSGSPPWAQAA